MPDNAERRIIEHISRIFSTIGDSSLEGIGDDCAVIPVGKDESLVVTTDMLCEGVHFLRHAASAADIGFKSLAVNLSDIAAMGARPLASLLSVSLPPECSLEWISGFMDGYRLLSERFSVALIGGDTVGSAAGITINVVAIGRAANSCIKRRSSARPGDIIMVNGPLGDSAAGLEDVLNGRPDTPAARLHHRPDAQVEQGIWLGGRDGVHAMMDLSDGLLSDLPRILDPSGLGAEIDTDKIPTCRTLRQAIAGGEDYKLLLTAEAGAAADLQRDYADRFGTQLYPVGRITAPGQKLCWLRHGVAFEPDMRPFDHMAAQKM